MGRSVIEVAVAIQARREHSKYELRRKLSVKGFENDEVDSAIEQLVANNLLSDERFTESYINMRKRKGYGPLRIEQELRERGVNSELADEFLDKHNPEWQDVLEQQYRKKYGDHPAAEYNEQARRARFMQNRGFPLDWVFRLEAQEDIY